MKEFSKRGLVETYEQAGTVADPDCVYILNASLPPSIIDTACRSLVRRLLDKAGYCVTSANQYISGYLPVVSLGLKFVLVQENSVSGVLSETNFVCGATDTIQTVGNFFVASFTQYSAGWGVASPNNTQVPKRFQLYTLIEDPLVPATYMFKTELNLVEEVINVMTKSSLKLQNRTLAANNSADAEDVSSNPLYGRSYLFKGIPKPKTLGTYAALNHIRGTSGVSLVRAQEMFTSSSGVTQSPKEPPLPNLFYNCSKSAKVYLNPGKLKTSFVQYSKKMKFLTWLKWLRIQYGSVDPFFYEYSTGECEMFAFEDMINVNSVNNITVAFEVNRTSAVYFTSIPNKFCDGTFTQATVYNNIPA